MRSVKIRSRSVSRKGWIPSVAVGVAIIPGLPFIFAAAGCLALNPDIGIYLDFSHRVTEGLTK